MHKMGIILGVVVFLAVGLGVAGGLSIIWMRQNAAEMEEIVLYTSMIEDLRTKVRQWVSSVESLLKGEDVKDFFRSSTISLEERIASLQAQPLHSDELKQIEIISSRLQATKGQLEGLLRGVNPLKPGEVRDKVNPDVKEISRVIEILVASHKIHVEKVRAKVDWTENLGKCISLAIPSTSILLAILLVLITGRSVIRSVGSLVSASRTMAEGDLSQPIGVVSRDEFGEIARAFEEMRKELRQKEQKLAQLSITDELTGLFNRRHLNGKLEEEITRARRFRHPLSVIFVDIDYFKKYNDLYGHLEGDRVLKGLAMALLGNTRDKIDTAYRYGGEEFVILVPESNTSQAMTVAERVLKDFSSKPFLPKPATEGAPVQPVYITFSAGVATLRENEDNSEKFLHRADQALFQAKTQGRNRIVAL
jgi:diguanylate cyclase (GGDEF)-like protein